MWRSLPVLLAALNAIGVRGPFASVLARSVQEEAQKRHFDPITLIVLIEGESHGNPELVNKHGVGCVGLLQVCPQYLYAECKAGTFDAVRCAARQTTLKNPLVSVRVASAAITSNQRFCRKLTGRAQWRHWLPSYGGYNTGSLLHKTGVWCGQRYTCTKRRGGRCVRSKWVDAVVPKTIQRYMRRHSEILRQISRRKRK